MKHRRNILTTSLHVCLAILGALSAHCGPATQDALTEQQQPLCGVEKGTECMQGTFCNVNVHRADGAGVCEPIPDACTTNYAPACGRNGTTYGNACAAHAAGVSVRHHGRCKETPGRPGPVPKPCPVPKPQPCGFWEGLDCSPGMFCNLDAAGCGHADATGVCEPIPDACTHDYRPVCGCNGRTYGNACAAHAAGVSVQHDGPCDEDPGCPDPIPVPGPDPKPDPKPGPKPDTCGFWEGFECSPGMFCNLDAAGDCGYADGTGVCAPIPDACTDDYRPVCGCNGRTYGNACAAHAAGVSVQYDGPCDEDPGRPDPIPVPGPDPKPDSCGFWEGFECSPGMFCNLEAAGDCGHADGTGVCVPVPDACTDDYRPVCGCNGRTYGNACAAHAAGVSVQHDGPCK